MEFFNKIGNNVGPTCSSEIRATVFYKPNCAMRWLVITPHNFLALFAASQTKQGQGIYLLRKGHNRLLGVPFLAKTHNASKADNRVKRIAKPSVGGSLFQRMAERSSVAWKKELLLTVGMRTKSQFPVCISESFRWEWSQIPCSVLFTSCLSCGSQATNANINQQEKRRTFRLNGVKKENIAIAK